ncbi:MAG: hypothetical protein M1305_00680 [Candidatus Marsarchaeota archaeon]|nr:hypothetical protein [Candidatus Marsarchaeota archaeon]
MPSVKRIRASELRNLVFTRLFLRQKRFRAIRSAKMFELAYGSRRHQQRGQPWILGVFCRELVCRDDKR